jgi:hypothetical protein
MSRDDERQLMRKVNAYPLIGGYGTCDFVIYDFVSNRLWSCGRV